MVKAKLILLEPNPNQFIRPQNIQQQSQVASDQNKSFTGKDMQSRNTGQNCKNYVVLERNHKTKILEFIKHCQKHNINYVTASVLDGIYFLTTIFENKNKNHAIVTCGGERGD